MTIAPKIYRQVVIELLRLVPIDRTAWKDLMMDGAFPVVKKIFKHFNNRVVVQTDSANPHVMAFKLS